MNNFGRLFRISIIGESHSDFVGIIIDGVPSGIPLFIEDFEIDLKRRIGGSLGTTPRKEKDIPSITTGIFNKKTTGAPLTILFENNNKRSSDYETYRKIPRPSHVDFVANRKYGGFEDYRGSGHFSGRLTICLVAAGVIAKKILDEIKISSKILSIAGEDPDMGLSLAIAAKDSVGGIVECRAENLPIGLGEPFFDSVESLISHIVFSIPSIRGIEFGVGFEATKLFGSEHNDSIIDLKGKTETNHSGGVVGGITNGNELIFRVAVKPTASTPKSQKSINWQSYEIEEFSIKGRHDLCIALRVPVILEAVTSIVLADLMMIEGKIKRIYEDRNN